MNECPKKIISSNKYVNTHMQSCLIEQGFVVLVVHNYSLLVLHVMQLISASKINRSLFDAN